MAEAIIVGALAPGRLGSVVALVVGAMVGIGLNMAVDRLGRPAPSLATATGARRAFAAWRGYVVVAITAIAFGISWRCCGVGALSASRLTLDCALILLFATDVDHRLLPNAITIPGILVGVAFGFAAEPGWAASIGGVVAGGGLLLGVNEIYRWRRQRDGLGMGDVKMLAMIGAFLGWQLAIVTLVIACFLGSAVGLALVGTKKGGMGQALPFGAFLSIGAAIAATAGPALLEWYARH